MATPVTKPSSPAATAPAVAPEARANAAVSNASHAHKWSRPFKYLWEFSKGTVVDGLDGTAKWAKKGMWFGVGMAVLFMFATGGAGSLFVPMLMGAGTGFLGGAALGGAFGLATGGVRGAQRLHRAEKYADDLIEKEKVNARPPLNNGYDYRDALRARNRQAGFIQDRVQQVEREIRDEVNATSWVDRVGSGQGFNHGRGF